jgi:hypothetical protein
MGRNQFSVYEEKPVSSIWGETSFQCMRRNQFPAYGEKPVFSVWGETIGQFILFFILELF